MPAHPSPVPSRPIGPQRARPPAPVRAVGAALAALALATACAAEPPEATDLAGATPAPFAGQELRVMTHDSFAASDAVLAAFEAQTGAKLRILESGDAGTALNQALLTRDAPVADVLYGVDNTYLSRALDGGLFAAYEAPALAELPAELVADPEHRALPVDQAEVCLNYDARWFRERGLAPPSSLEDLARPELAGLLVVPNAAASSPGLAFLLTTVAAYGEPGYLDYWRRLLANDVRVVNDWETAYNAEFSGGPGRGERPIVVSYSSSPAFEVLYGEGVTEPGTAAVTAPGTCFRQLEFVGILAGTPRRALAERWVDFMLGPEFQADMPAQMFVFPVRPGVPLDPVFQRFLATAEAPAELSAAAIAAGREGWIDAWTEVVLR